MTTPPKELLTLSQAARRVPAYENGRHVSPSTIWRWIVHGIRIGDRTVRLESYPIGRRLLVAPESIDKFSADLREARREDIASKPEPDAETTEQTRSDAQRQRDLERTQRELEEAGI